MQVIELDRLSFSVQATTKAGEDRLVDMTEYQGSGFCSCWFFANQIRGPLEDDIKQWRAKGGEPFTYVPNDRYQCDHIRAVRVFLSNRVVQAVRKQFPDDDQKV